MKVYEAPGGLGKFEYEVTADILKIVLPVEFIFIKGNKTLSPGFGIEEYEWKNDLDKQVFKNAMRTQTKAVWQGVYDFERRSHGVDSDRRLALSISIEERPMDPIWKVYASHDPGDLTSPQASVCDPGKRHFGAGCITIPPANGVWGTLAMSQALIEPIEVLISKGDEHKVWFKIGSIDYAFEQQLRVEFQNIIARLKSNTSWTVIIIGAASPDETSPAASDDINPHPAITLARARANKVGEFLKQFGVDHNRISYTIKNPFVGGYGDDEAYVEVKLSSERQSTFAHEVGHLLGLRDEYDSHDDHLGTPVPFPDYIALIERWGYHLPLRGSTRSIMSRGNTVFPRHYVHFLDLLSQEYPAYDWALTTREDYFL